MGGHPGNELQLVHRLQLFDLFPIPVADPAFLFVHSALGHQEVDIYHSLGILPKGTMALGIPIHLAVPIEYSR